MEEKLNEELKGLYDFTKQKKEERDERNNKLTEFQEELKKLEEERNGLPEGFKEDKEEERKQKDKEFRKFFSERQQAENEAQKALESKKEVLRKKIKDLQKLLTDNRKRDVEELYDEQISYNIALKKVEKEIQEYKDSHYGDSYMPLDMHKQYTALKDNIAKNQFLIDALEGNPLDKYNELQSQLDILDKMDIDKISEMKDLFEPKQKDPNKGRHDVNDTPLNTDELFEELREDGDLPKKSNKTPNKEPDNYSQEQKDAWKGSRLNYDELMKELDDDNAGGKGGTGKNEDWQKVSFDMSTGKYVYTSSKGDTYTMSMFDRNGEERLTEFDKEDIIDELISQGIDEKSAKRVDPYIYEILNRIDPESRDKYIFALDEPMRGMGNLSLTYDLRTKVDGVKKERKAKYSLLQRVEMMRKTRYHEKKGLAEVLRSKSRARLYALLAAVGISTVAGGTKLLTDSNKSTQKQETERTTEVDPNTPTIQILSGEAETEKKTEKGTQTESKETNTTKPAQAQTSQTSATKPAQAQTNQTSATKPAQAQTSQTSATKPAQTTPVQVVEPGKTTNVANNEKAIEGDTRVGSYVTTRLGAHLYEDPYDAVYEQLNKATNGNVVVKTKNADRVYKVTKEGLYCPDGRCIEISNGDLETAMRQAGMDVNILKNIDSEELERQGYKRMLHVVADGIAQWVEEGDTLQLQVDKFGNRVEKTETEKQIDVNAKINDDELAKKEQAVEETVIK